VDHDFDSENMLFGATLTTLPMKNGSKTSFPSHSSQNQFLNLKNGQISYKKVVFKNQLKATFFLMKSTKSDYFRLKNQLKKVDYFGQKNKLKRPALRMTLHWLCNQHRDCTPWCFRVQI
jgi:hypothetical protein